VQVEHDGIENATTAPVVTLTIDGVMSDPAAVGTPAEYTNADYNDLNEGATTTDPCDPNSHDTQDFTLTPRPDITTTTPFDSSVPTALPIQQFEPKLP